MLFEDAVLQKPHPGGTTQSFSLVPRLGPPIGFARLGPPTRSVADGPAVPPLTRLWGSQVT
jgi:hypothetical protein